MIQESEEIVSIVNEKDELIGPSPRSQVRLNNLIHRCTYIFLYNPRIKKFIIQKRSLKKKYCPGYIDLCFGGVVQYGESYDENARRELKEEIGMESELSEQKQTGLHSLFTFFHQDQMSRCWGSVYMAYTEKEQFVKQDEEVEAIYFYSIQEMLKLEQKVTPDSLEAFKILLEKHNQKIE